MQKKDIPPSFRRTLHKPIFRSSVNHRPIAIVAAYINQTEQRDVFFKTGLIAAPLVCLMTGLAFLIPAIAWYRRTKEKQQADRRIRFLAHHDALTGLANRAQLIEKLENALAVLPLRGGCLAVHFIDLDRFKEVNDTLGHDGGDFLLKTIAERLRAVTRVDDMVARLGGDEFVVVQTGISGKEQAEEFARRLAAAVTAPMKFKEQEIVATVSIGVALAPADGTRSGAAAEERRSGALQEQGRRSQLHPLLRAGDGRGAAGPHRAREDGPRRGRHERFVLHYQPVFEMSGQRLIGFEALVRLPAADGTLIPPLTFIPVAEDMRLIDKIGAWVLREACRTAATWPEPLTVAVNLSPAQFEAGSVSTIVANALKEAGLAPHRLELEITETLLLGNNEAIMAELQTLKAMGVAIVMDDFGTGYSSLSYLWRFPFDKIKIDRSFMQGFEGSGRDAETVVKTIIALGRELNMRVTVEGVETAQAGRLFSMGPTPIRCRASSSDGRCPASEIGAVILNNFQKSLLTQPAASPHEARLQIVKSAAER